MENKTIVNKTCEKIILEQDKANIGPLARILNSQYDGWINIEQGSCINRVNIGKYSSIGLFSYVADTIIGRYCSIASRVSIGAFNHPTNWLSIHEFQYRNGYDLWKESLQIENKLNDQSKKTEIGNDVWVGDNSVILRGVKVGNGAIIGASTVVVKDVDPYSIVVGNPGKEIKKRFSDSVIKKLENLCWWELDISDLYGVEFDNIENAILQIKSIKSSVLHKSFID